MQENLIWLLNIIDSCMTTFQLASCHNLVDLFERMHTQEDGFKEANDKLLDRMKEKDTSLIV